jgi:hypothetical protein
MHTYNTLAFFPTQSFLFRACAAGGSTKEQKNFYGKVYAFFHQDLIKCQLTPGFIEALVIERILDQIGEWCPSPPPRAPPAEPEWHKGCQIPLSCHPVPDIA